MQQTLERLSEGLELPGGRARLEPLRPGHAAGLLAALDNPQI